MFSLWSVCLCAKISKSCEQILMIFSKNARVLGTNRLAFGEDPDTVVDPVLIARVVDFLLLGS